MNGGYTKAQLKVSLSPQIIRLEAKSSISALWNVKKSGTMRQSSFAVELIYSTRCIFNILNKNQELNRKY